MNNDKEGYNTLKNESMQEGTSLLPDINAHKQQYDPNNILESEGDEDTFSQFRLQKGLGSKSVANYNDQDGLPPPDREVDAVTEQKDIIRKGKISVDIEPSPSQEGSVAKSDDKTAAGKGASAPAMQAQSMQIKKKDEKEEGAHGTNRKQYDSRNDFEFHDNDSLYDESDREVDDNAFPKNSMDALEKKKQLLEKEAQRLQAQMEVEAQKKALGANADQEVKPNKRFKNFNDLFSSLTRSKNVSTVNPIVNCCITYNSKSAITVTKKDDREYWVKQHSLETYIDTFEERIGNGKTSYIKLKEVEQNAKGTKFAIAYLDDGRFRIRIFGEENRDPNTIEGWELDINKELNMNNHTMPINDFPDPFISCVFIDDNLLFVNLFHNATLTHHHFFYSFEDKDQDGNWLPALRNQRIHDHKEIKLECNKKNFPQKCYYNCDNNEVYSFYRQGQSFRVPVMVDQIIQDSITIEKPEGETYKMHDQNEGKNDCYEQKIYDKDLGDMYLIYEQALIIRCSSQMLFFKIEIDEFTQDREWVIYHTLDANGFIYFIKGNSRIQITTDTHVYFYIIDKETFMPELENVMQNFMNCSQMMFGSRVKYGITYKTNNKSIDIHRRKYEHDFRLNVIEDDLDGSRGLPVDSMNAFLVSKIDTVKFYSIDTFREIEECKIKIALEKAESNEREKNEIITMQISACQKMLAIISGKNLIMNEQKPSKLYLYKRTKNQDPTKMDLFKHIKTIDMSKIKELDKISMRFFFKNTKGDKEPNEIIFAKQDSIVVLNVDQKEVFYVVKFDVTLSKQPEFFCINEDQTVYIVASLDDAMLYYSKQQAQAFFDLDDTYKISDIKEIINDHEDQCFYLVANKYQDKLGVFIIRFDEDDPNHSNFFLKYKNKLDIADVDIAVSRCEINNLKELIIGYKTIHSNIYTVQVVDISRETPWPLYKHESFQLWESQITAFFINRNKEYIMMNRDGISVISLGSEGKRFITGSNGQEKIIHPLESTNYLKVEHDNYIRFEFSGEKKVIHILQQFQKKNSKTGEETAWEDVYKIRICDITLRQLLLFQSLYVCNTQSDIFNLVKGQSNPSVFYKSFLELDGTNIVSILAFDSRSMQYILDDKFCDYFDQEYPLFYKNKIQKTNKKDRYFYRSAIDNALRNNQVSAIAIMINYIVQYQNNFVSSFLFVQNIQQLLEKGIKVQPLIQSKIFRFQFDYDEWASTHTDDKTYMKPYNGSIFELRDQYRNIFSEPQFEINEEEDSIDSRKVYKIKYSINTLTQLGEYVQYDANGGKSLANECVSLLQLCAEADELELFETDELDELITFKWESFARSFMLIGCFFHFCYLTIMIIYVNAIYINNDKANATLYGILLMLGIIYPMFYDIRQLYLLGPKEYFQDIFNYSDQIYVWASFFNVISQNFTDSFTLRNKLLMTVIFLQQIIKSFFYLRIFKSLSYIVTMIYTVIADLRVFLLFFTILVVLFGQIFAVLGVGNSKFEGSALYEYVQDGGDDVPFEEYEQIGLFWGTLFSTLRIAMGDFDFGAANYLTSAENGIYWFIWLLVVVMTCIIFLNFIIAEASASYEKVKENLKAQINKEKSTMVGEAEGQLPYSIKNEILFPKYVVIREVEI